MPKQVTEDDLASGLSGFGDGLSTISEKRSRRDNPFRDTRSEPPRRGAEEKVIEMRSPAEPAVVPERDPKDELLERARAAQARAAAQSAARGEGKERPFPSGDRVPTIEESAQRVKVTFAEPEGVTEHPAPARKADIFTERITLLVSSEMRDKVDNIARELQRRRTKKEERITANTVMRVAINSFLERFELEESEVVNTEEELLELANGKVR